MSEAKAFVECGCPSQGRSGRRRAGRTFQFAAACAALFAGFALTPIAIAVPAPPTPDAIAHTRPMLAQAPAQPAPPQGQPRPAQPRSQPPAKSQGKAAPAGGGGDAQLRQRVEQLEEQIVDMQVIIGTLESLARAGGGGGAGRATSSTGASEAARIDVLETQIRALTQQVELLARQPRGGGAAMPAPGPAVAEPVRPPAVPPGGFGTVTVSPGGPANDPIGQVISSSQAASEPPRELPPAIANAAGNPKDLYETAYGYLLQQDYAAAEAAFEEFLRRYPNDRLAADAQYWLGESLFVQRRYRPAGQAFLRVVQAHRTSAKAPNSLLMLAMTLEQLGQKDCALFTELDTRHPNASADVKSRARILRQRVGC